MTKLTESHNSPQFGIEPSHIQPFGYFLLLKPDDFSVLKCSKNVYNDFSEGWHESAGSLLGAEAEILIKKAVLDLNEADRKFISIPVLKKGRCSAWISMVNGLIMLEVETQTPDLDLSALNLEELSYLARRVKEAYHYVDIYKRSCSMVRYLTGFERVYMIRFNDDGSSTVVGESRRKHLDTMLGLKFKPEHPVNLQRKLLVENRLRLVPNVDYESIEIGPDWQEDWIFSKEYEKSALRGLRQAHQALMKLLGIKSYLSLPVGNDSEISGIIIAVNENPVLLAPEIRLLLEDFGKNISTHLHNKQREKDLSLDIGLKIRVQFIIEKVKSNFPGQTLEDDILPDMLDLFNNTGVAAVLDGHISMAGECPSAEALKIIAGLARTRLEGGVFVHQCLGKIDERLKACSDRAAGCIAVALDADGSDLILFLLAGRNMTSYWVNSDTPDSENLEYIEYLPGYRLHLERQSQTTCSEPISSVEIENARLFIGARNLLVNLQ